MAWLDTLRDAIQNDGLALSLEHAWIPYAETW
jgi:hypothetical protein